MAERKKHDYNIFVSLMKRVAEQICVLLFAVGVRKISFQQVQKCEDWSMAIKHEYRTEQKKNVEGGAEEDAAKAGSSQMITELEAIPGGRHMFPELKQNGHEVEDVSNMWPQVTCGDLLHALEWLGAPLWENGNLGSVF